MNEVKENSTNSVMNGVEHVSVLESVTDLSLFTVKRILGEDVDRKIIFIEVNVKDSEKPAVITLEQLPFTPSQVESLMGAESNTPALNDFINDIYGQFKLRPEPQFNQIKANIVHPASEKHIQKFLSSPSHLIVETPQLYRSASIFCNIYTCSMVNYEKQAELRINLSISDLSLICSVLRLEYTRQ